jgi:Rrf2 family protein
MMFLAEAPAGGPPIPMNRIAAEANVPRKFLELILADLREAGFLHSHRGKMGGYCLSRPKHLISLGEIIRVIEGPLALVPCVSRTAYRPCRDCKDEATCAIRHAMMRVRDETAESEMSLAWLSMPEWRLLLAQEGFEVEALYGWFDRSPWAGGEDSIWVCRLPD